MNSFWLIFSVPKAADIPGVVPKNNQLPSASAQVRRYLKGLWKKKPLEKAVEKCRESYGESLAQSKNKPNLSELRLKLEEKQENQYNDEYSLAQKKKAECEMKLRM